MKNDLKIKAIKLRSRGYSINEIFQKTGVAKSTAHLWTKKVVLNKKAKLRIIKRGDDGRAKGAAAIRLKKELLKKQIRSKISKEIRQLKFSKEMNKLLCAMLFWCEGSRNDSHVVFTNSDPILIATFLKLFRSSFKLQENKFNVCVHLHEYHNEAKQIEFWSNITKIPVSQFMKPFHKSNTGKNKRLGYPGCAAINYYDYKVALELHYVWKMFGDKVGK